ncbi:MAG: Gfo/Idh/MocA family oxidoreductase [Defluviitaleaceae bacterium]|nr:Gfo/Idh/MocA family oxidoreductase [Defluviitaleaceae bacterium]
MKIGVLCPSEIAFRRFMPALKKSGLFEFVGVAFATADEWHGGGFFAEEQGKAENFCKEYGGKVIAGYTNLLASDADCVYIPLPPALHFDWAKKTLKNGKHILLEKPFTTNLQHTQTLLDIAKASNLAVHENYMFQFHSQIAYIQEELAKGTIGETRLIKIDFGFPFRGTNDFRYSKEMGGGALLDCGGYTVKLAAILLGKTAKIANFNLNYSPNFAVDLFGNATMTNENGTTAQLSFGMDNDYRCNLDIWGSKGSIFTDRILTAPADFPPTVRIRVAQKDNLQKLPADDSFLKSIQFFGDCVGNVDVRVQSYDDVLRQAVLMEEMLGGG